MAIGRQNAFSLLPGGGSWNAHPVGWGGGFNRPLGPAPVDRPQFPLGPAPVDHPQFGGPQIGGPDATGNPVAPTGPLMPAGGGPNIGGPNATGNPVAPNGPLTPAGPGSVNLGGAFKNMNVRQLLQNLAQLNNPMAGNSGIAPMGGSFLA